MRQTREPQYMRHMKLRDREGAARLGLMSNYAWHNDPRHLLFILSRYKFAAKLLAGKRNALEVGCGDAFGTRIVAQEVPAVTAVDFDPVFIGDARERMDPCLGFECRVHDILGGPVPGRFEAAYSLDVIEHIPKERERDFLRNVCGSLERHGLLILGTPSLQSQAYASEESREGHVNLKDAPSLRALMAEAFHNVLVFSMNDEVVHTGFHPMAHYLFAIGCSLRAASRARPRARRA